MDQHADRSDEGGFSLIEVVTAMCLLAIVSMAFLPLVARASTAAATSSTLATATHLVGNELERVRAKPTTVCPATAPEGLGSPIGPLVRDGRGAELQLWGRYDGTCADGAGMVRYVVTVTRPPATAPVATAATLLVVGPR